MTSKKDLTDKIDFGLTPAELKAYLDRYVVNQEEAKLVLATKVATHFNRVRLAARLCPGGSARNVGQIKNNVLLIGPTGVGKTYLVKLIARRLGAPLVKGDATKFSETGYVGQDVEDLVRELYYEAGEDQELTEHGIIYIDEIDKIAAGPSLVGPDVSRSGVQRALLKPMEETEVNLRVSHDPLTQLMAIDRYRQSGKYEKKTINTRDILFILSGAFPGLAEITRKRLTGRGLGFTAPPGTDPAPLAGPRAEDLIEYGFEAEFVGRAPVVTVLKPLSAADLEVILNNPFNPVVTGKKKDFSSYGIDLAFEPEALAHLARQAQAEGTGARGLVAVMERALLPFEAGLPGSQVTGLTVTPGLVADPAAELTRLLAAPEDPLRLERHAHAVEAERDKIIQLVKQKASNRVPGHDQALGSRGAELVASLVRERFQDLDEAAQTLVGLYEEFDAISRRLYVDYGLKVSFTQEARDELLGVLGPAAQGTDIYQAVLERFEYGLNIIQSQVGLSEFTIGRQAVLNPEEFLSALVARHAASYRFQQ